MKMVEKVECIHSGRKFRVESVLFKNTLWTEKMQAGMTFDIGVCIRLHLSIEKP
jgi:hypothetical protein